MSALPELSGWHAGALIRDENGEPTWRYRVEPFQRAVFESGMTLGEVELCCGFAGRGGYLSRVLGLRRQADSAYRQAQDGTWSKYEGKMASSLSYENAVRIARALNLDFVEWEL